jgi:hypothetical protein
MEGQLFVNHQLRDALSLLTNYRYSLNLLYMKGLVNIEII